MLTHALTHTQPSILKCTHIHTHSRWRAAPTSLVLHTRTALDVEESQVTLQGDEHTTRSLLDVLTCSCMQ